MAQPRIPKHELEWRASTVIAEYGGVVPYAEVCYLHSIIYSASRCLRSFAEYETARSERADAEHLVSVVQEAIGHAAALSRYFWPSTFWLNRDQAMQRLKQARAEKLRTFFGLDSGSPLQNRDLRNAWEHFDERLDVYLLEHDSGFFLPTSLIETHELADDEAGHIFKLLDPVTECLVLLGRKYFFGAIRDAVRIIHDKATVAERNGGRLR